MINSKQIHDVIGADIEAEARGNVARSGPSMAEKLAARFGGTTDRYSLIVLYYREAWNEKQKRNAVHNWRMSVLAEMEANLTNRPRPLPPAPKRASAVEAALERSQIGQLEDRIALHGTAQHEAAHCVMVLIHGGTVVGIEASPTTGSIQYRGVSAGAETAVIVAGVVGCEAPRGLADPWAGQDRADLLASLREKIPGQSDEDLLAYAWSTAPYIEESLTRHWGFFKRLANELVKRGRLDGAEVHRIWDSFGYKH